MSDPIASVLHQSGQQQSKRSGMFWFITLRLIQHLFFTIILLIGVIFFVALAMNLAAGGGYKAIAEAAPAALDATIEVIGNIFSGDIEGTRQLQRTLPRSLGLLFASLILGTTLGILFGGLAALYRNTRLSAFIINLSIIGISTPSYVAAMFLIWSVVWGYQQTGVRILPIYGFGFDLRMVMPTLVLSSRPMANITRLTYTALKDVFEADFVRTAYGKGLRTRMVFLKHVLRNSGIPILTTASVSFRFSLSMLPIVEAIFSWVGIGYALIEAAQTGNLPVLVLMIIPFVLLYSLITMMLDFVYPLIDPRLLDPKGVE
jgi:ABC-type dipeptide/oligopeptide/nickel transport system permease component